MNKLDLETIKKILSLIDKFDKENGIKYIERNDITSLEDFVKLNSEFILETIDFIEVYIDIYNSLDELDLHGLEIPCYEIYDPSYLELLIDSYHHKKDNYIITNILLNQKIVIYEALQEAQKNINKLIKILNIYNKLLETENPIIYQQCINELYKILSEEDEDSGSIPLDELLKEFSTILKNTYGIKKKNVKIKVLKKY